MDYTQVLLKPLISEKGTAVKEQFNQVVFIVHKDANKFIIKEAVERAFNVQVTTVNVVRQKPVQKVFTRGRKRMMGTVSGYKKAYVTLAAGNKIEFFEGV